MLALGKEKPATTPVYVFDKGDVIINEKQAEKLGITIPDSIKQEAKMFQKNRKTRGMNNDRISNFARDVMGNLRIRNLYDLSDFGFS